jgi:hypothetical protein
MKNIFNIKIHLIYGGVVSGYLPNGNFWNSTIGSNKGKETVTVNGKVGGIKKLVKNSINQLTLEKPSAVDYNAAEVRE